LEGGKWPREELIWWRSRSRSRSRVPGSDQEPDPGFLKDFFDEMFEEVGREKLFRF